MFRLFVALLLLTACGQAAHPISESKAAYDELLIKDDAIADIPFHFCPETVSYHPGNAVWLSYFAVASYTKDEVVAEKLESLGFGSPSSGAVRFVTDGEVVDGVFQNYSAQAYFARHSTQNLSVISFRGTEFDEGRDIVTDLNIFMEPYENGGQVHSGFLASFKTIEAKLVQILKEESAGGTLNLWLTGHSLGGSQANLMLAHILALKAKGELPNVKVLGVQSIGAPKIGDQVFAQKLDADTEAAGIANYRIRNHADLVTALPGTLINPFSYYHAGALIYIDGEARVHYGDGWQAIEGGSDYLETTALDPNDHLTSAYFDALKTDYLAQPPEIRDVCETPGKPLQPFRDYRALSPTPERS